MSAKTWMVLGASLGALAMAAGTFGAHFLPKYLEMSGASALLGERQQWWETGARYQMYHALALLSVAWVADRNKSLLPGLAGLAMFAGALLFSSCMYALALTGLRAIGAIAPLGGVLLISGWILLAVAGLRLGLKPADKELTAREKLVRGSTTAAEELTEDERATHGPAANGG